MKKVLKILLIVLLCLILVVGGYVAYVFIAYHRAGSGDLEVGGSGDAKFAPGSEYKIVSYNIGFGAYESDFGFFMDGGDRARAWSKDRLDANLKKIASLLSGEKADLYFIQEVDFGSTRSYHFDERDYLTSELKGYSYSFAENWDSPFLFYPITQPHGSAKSGIMTFSAANIEKAERVELPVETGVMKLIDLDRCYSKNFVPVDGGKDLVLYDFHLSAYTSDGKIAEEQLKLLIEDIKGEYAKGNYCIAGGDFNKDILGNSSVYFGKSEIEYTWAQPLPDGIFDGTALSLVAPLDEAHPVPTCRNADSEYHEGQYVLTIDGFIVSENIEVVSSAVIDTQFAYSDHNPVTMSFILK